MSMAYRSFTGKTGTTWITVAGAPSGVWDGGFSDYTPSGYASFYGIASSSLARYDASPTDAWTSLSSLPAPIAGGNYAGPAWVGTKLYALASNRVMAFDISAGTWSTPLTIATNVAGAAQHTHDDSGRVYAVGSLTAIVVYDTVGNTLTTKTASMAGSVSEPRIAWDSLTQKLYIAPNFYGVAFYSFDPATSTTTALTSIPDTTISDVFCTDRGGHIYAGGKTSATQMWQYTITTDTWVKLSAAPTFNSGNVGACTVTADGWLYYDNGGSSVEKLQLL
jgi:hypothetical protein